MAIEIYDKAKIVKKDDKYYYLLKYGSKNSFTCGGQSVMDDNFNMKYLHRDNRDSHWSVIAIGNEEDYKNDRIADTYWNSPTSEVYGRIRFGNGYNIALYFAKVRKAGKTILFERLTEQQQSNLRGTLEHGEKSDWTINLSDIPERRKFKNIIEYCGKKFELASVFDNLVTFLGRGYWKLNNL